jgi:hypothetical protein
LGVPPHWDLWLHLFKAEHFTKAADGRGPRKMVRAGSCRCTRSGRTCTSQPSSCRPTGDGRRAGSIFIMTTADYLPTQVTL